jgi:hypothetical protein
MVIYHIMWLSSLKMAVCCWNVGACIWNKAVVQICALCWFFLLRLIMQDADIKLCLLSFVKAFCQCDIMQNWIVGSSFVEDQKYFGMWLCTVS